jgi:hypothetical protein
MIKGEDQVSLVKDKFHECEGYFNQLEKIFYNSSDTESDPAQAIPKIAMMVGKLMTNFSDITVLLEIFPKDE